MHSGTSIRKVQCVTENGKDALYPQEKARFHIEDPLE